MTRARKSLLWGFLIGLVLWTADVLAADNVTILVHLFKGAWSDGHAELKEFTVMTAASHPEIEALKAKVGGPEGALKTAAAATLIDVMDLKTVDHLFSFAEPWSGRETRVSEAIHVGQTVFLFNFDPKRLSPQKVALTTLLFRSKTPGEAGPVDDRLTKELMDAFTAGKASVGMEKILDLGLDLDISDPAIVAIPTEDTTYFMLLALTAGTKTVSQIEFAGGPKVLHQVVPSYPDELRRQGIEGQVELQVGVDEEGNVGGVRILKSLHPYLDNSAVQALKQWRYEPVYQNGAAVPAIITLTVNFTREAYRAQEESEETQKGLAAGPVPSSQAELAKILEKCADYCEKLKGAALDYICEETIRDVYFNLPTEEERRKKSSVVLWLMSRRDGSVSQLGISSLPFPNIERTERNEYVCDYLFVKKGEGIAERRIILKENGRKLPDRSKILEERRFATLTPYLAPVRLLGRNRQPLFDYRLLKSDKIRGKETYVVEVSPKAGNAAGVEYAKVWVEKKSSQAVKVEMTGVPFEGYESVLRELIQYNTKAKFVATYSYEVEKKELAFPSEVKIRVNYPYPEMMPEVYKIEKIRTDLKYDKYKFYTVETEGAVKK